MIWLYSGFFSLGSFAGQVQRPQSTYLRGTVILLFISVLLNVLPVLAAISMDSTRANFDEGHFAVLGGRRLGRWFQVAIQIGAVLSNVGLYNSQVLYTDTTLIFLLHRVCPSFIEAWKRRAVQLPWLLDIQSGTCRVVILGNATLISSLTLLPFTVLVEASMLLSSFACLLSIFAFLHLRRIAPHMTRPYRVPFGLVGCCLSLTPAILLLSGNIVLSCLPPGVVSDGEWLGYHFRVYMSVAVFGTGFATHAVWREWCRRYSVAPPSLLQEDTQATQHSVKDTPP
mmetsp:Transcript_21909/g.47662  ORF Transcript_21909/g.47662 Transcript_21909/m.47662 type:complete len:284 (-) Transcript_21909:131-982(-)